MTVNEFKEKAVVGKATVVVVKKKKDGRFTIYPKIINVAHTFLPIAGECYAIIVED